MPQPSNSKRPTKFQTLQAVPTIASGISRKLSGRAAALALLAMSLSTNAVAGKWSIVPDITVRGTYTDNAALTAPPSGGEFVTQVTPGIRIHGGGARFKGNLDYRPSALFYSRHTSQDSIVNTLNGAGTLEAVENFFFVDVFGNISQTFISPFAPQPSNLTSFTSNRTEARTYGISPYVQGHVGNAFSYQLRYRDTRVSTNSSLLPKQETQEWTGHAASPIRLFGWALDYDNSNIIYNNYAAGHQYSRLYRGTLYYQPDITLRLSADGGAEENNYFLEQRSNSIYGAGLSWRPTPLTSADLNVEHRFFGTSRLASFRHRTRLTAWTVAYSKNVSTSQQLLTVPLGNTAALLDTILAARIPDPVERQAAVEQFLRTSGIPPFLSASVAFFTQQVVLQERLDASVGILGRRSSVFLNAFRAKTEPLTSNFTSAVPDAFLLSQGPITQHGFGVSASRQLTPLTTLVGSANRTYARQDVPTTIDSRNDSYTLSLTRTLSPKTTTFAGLSFAHFTSSSASASGSSNARAVFVGLSHFF